MSGRSTACPPAVFQYHLCLGDRFGSPRMGQTLETKLQDNQEEESPIEAHVKVLQFRFAHNILLEDCALK